MLTDSSQNRITEDATREALREGREVVFLETYHAAMLRLDFAISRFWMEVAMAIPGLSWASRKIAEKNDLNCIAIRGGQSSGVSAQSVALPRYSIDDPRFRYVPACKTDLAETFRRARERQA